MKGDQSLSEEVPSEQRPIINWPVSPENRWVNSISRGGPERCGDCSGDRERPVWLGGGQR